MLNHLQITALPEGKKIADGAGLYFKKKKNGEGTWSFRYRLNERSNEISLGKYPAVGIMDARQLCLDQQKLIAQGIDPSRYRQAQKQKKEATRILFSQIAYQVHSLRAPNWRSPIHKRDWLGSLERYAFPILDQKQMVDLRKEDIVRVLEPIWIRLPETARRVRHRIDACFAYAIAKELYHSPNPAIYRGNLDSVFPKRNTPIKHHKAIDYEDLPKLFSLLRSHDNITSFALQFCILTVARTKMIREASWDQINFERQQWRVPGHLMKTGKDHVAFLSSYAIDLLKQTQRLHNHELIFPGKSKDGRLCTNAMLFFLQKSLNMPSYTVHGFRSSFRNWAAESHVDFNVAEFALAHQPLDNVQRAYYRSAMYMDRIKMAQLWSDFLLKDGVLLRQGVLPV